MGTKVTKEALRNFIEQARKENWNTSTILQQIEMFAKNYRGVNLSDLAIILIDGDQD
jgi:hypothetical protein